MHTGCPFMHGYWTCLVDSFAVQADGDFEEQVRLALEHNPTVLLEDTQLRVGTACLSVIQFLHNDIDGRQLRPDYRRVVPHTLNPEAAKVQQGHIHVLTERLYQRVVEIQLTEDPKEKPEMLRTKKRLDKALQVLQVLSTTENVLLGLDTCETIGFEFCSFLSNFVCLGEHEVWEWGRTFNAIRTNG